jgi:glucose/arabinose dehydrogenase
MAGVSGHRRRLTLGAAGALATAAVGMASLGATPSGGSAAASRGIAKQRIGSFADPMYVAHAPGAPKFLYVVERAGLIEVMKHGHRLKRPFLDIRGRVTTDGERGLLSMAFDPRYAHNGLFYVYYTNSDGNIEVDSFHAKSGSTARPASRRRVIVIPHPGAANHNGATLAFGPGGHLYLATGDGGFAGDPHENAQNHNVLLGKLLRIDPHAHGKKPYSVPKGNPFVGRAGRNEIYALGLRNPFRFSFDRGRILIGDVGQARWEEVDFEGRRALRGSNFGWDHFEGRHRFDYPGDNEAPRPKHRYRPPILEYAHNASNCGGGSCAITGGVVVRDHGLGALRGRYIYADFYKGDVRSLAPHHPRGRHDHAIGLHVDHPSSFSVGAHNHVYVTSLDGPVYRLVRR